MLNITDQCQRPMETGNTDDGREAVPQWHVLWTKSNCEKLVYEQLRARDFQLFFPTVDKWSKRRNSRRLYRAPMFPGYLFVRQAIDKYSYIEIAKTRGMVRILGERWDKLAVIPEPEIEIIRKIHHLDMPRMPHPYLKQGQLVRITTGPLKNVEGIFVKSEPRKGLLVLSIELLRQSLAVRVDCNSVVPA